MSQNTTTRRSFLNSKETSNTPSINPMNFQSINPHIQFQDPQSLSLYKASGSNVVRKSVVKPNMDFNATQTGLVLENFLPYAKAGSNKPRGTGDAERNVRIQTKIVLKGSEIDKSDEISAPVTVREKENNAALSNRYSKHVTMSTGKEGLMKTMVVKSVKPGQERYKRTDSRDQQYDDAVMAEGTPKSGEAVPEKSEWEREGSSSNNISIREQGKSEDRVKMNSRERVMKVEIEQQEENKFEFTLGSFRPERKSLVESNPETQEEGYKKSSQSVRTVVKDNNSMEVSSREQKSRRRSKIDGLEEAHRVQTEVEEQRNKEEREILSRAHKLKQSLGQEDMKQMMKPPLNGLQVNKTPKELGSTQKITKLEEQIMMLRSENMRQSEAIDILIDLVKETKKTPKGPNEPRNSDLIIKSRSPGITSQSKLYSDIKYDPGKIVNTHSGIESEKRGSVNLYSKDYMDGGYEAKRRPPALDEETPCFGSTLVRQKKDVSFANLFMSPVRHMSKIPKVNDPTRQERVYSSPISSFVERNHILPLIPDTRSTKSGTAETSVRNLDYIREANHNKRPSAFSEGQQQFNFEQGRTAARGMSISKQIKMVSNSDKEESRKEEYELRRNPYSQPTLSLLPGLGKVLSDNGGNRMDSLDQLRFANDLKKFHIRDNDLGEIPQVQPDSKNKGKILKEVFSLNWKKKSCV